MIQDNVKLTKYSANWITILINLVQPSFNVGERLDTCDIVHNYNTMRSTVVAEAQHFIHSSSYWAHLYNPQYTTSKRITNKKVFNNFAI